MDAAELILDSILTDGVLREIPIVSTVVGLAKAGFTVRGNLFIQKVLRFLNPLSKYTREQRQNYLAKLDQDEVKQAGQYMILYLERLDSLDKPAMLSKVFEAYMLQKIDCRQMLYFTHFIDSVFILVWKNYHRAIKLWHDNQIDWPRIEVADALALERVGFYTEEHEREEQIIGEPSPFEVSQTVLADVKRKLVPTQAGWEFIQVVFQQWTTDRSDQPHPEWYRLQLSLELGQGF